MFQPIRPELSVIIVNYNGINYLKDCLDSLYLNLSAISFEIIIIDNDSKDGSCAYIDNNYPDVVLIASTINYGFGKGNNEAVKQAKGDYLLLINNDTIVLDQLLPALDFIKNDPTIGLLGINMLDKNKNYLPVAGVFPNIKSMFQMKKLLKINSEFETGLFTQSSYEVDWLSASFVLLPKTTFDKIKGFDEDYFLYVEDVDFSKKIQQIGLKRVFFPSLNYIHFVGFTNSKNHLLVKGYEIYIHKHCTGIYKKVMLWMLMINSGVKRIKLKLKLN